MSPNPAVFQQLKSKKILGPSHTDTSVEGPDKCETPARNDIKATSHETGGWSGPKGQQNKMEHLHLVLCNFIAFRGP